MSYEAETVLTRHVTFVDGIFFVLNELTSGW
jgi:hypothetical protein